MPSVTIPNVASVTVKGRLFGQDVENVWYVLVGPTPEVFEFNAIAAAFESGYGAIMPALSQDLSITEIVVKDMNVAAGVETTLAITPAMTGGAATASMPGGTALCISLRTALGGRQFRGRKYFSGIPTSEVVENSFTSDFVDSILTGVSTLLTALVTVDHPIQVASPTYGTSSQVIAAIATDLYVDSQRRRLTGRGA